MPMLVSWRLVLAGVLALAAALNACAAESRENDRWSSVRILLENYQSATRWRTAFEHALQRPQDGGIWLASVIVQRCADAERVVSGYVTQVATLDVSGPALRQRQLAALRLDQLCAGFALDENNAVQRSRLALDSDAARLDPLLDLRRRYREAVARGESAAVDAALRDALSLGSSLFFERLEVGTTERGKVFDGQVYAKDEQRGDTLYDAAMFLAVCDAWRDCPESEYVLLKGCVELSLCATFRDDYVPMVLAVMVPGKRAVELHALTERMYDALRAGAVERFRVGEPTQPRR